MLRVIYRQVFLPSLGGCVLYNGFSFVSKIVVFHQDFSSQNLIKCNALMAPSLETLYASLHRIETMLKRTYCPQRSVPIRRNPAIRTPFRAQFHCRSLMRQDHDRPGNAAVWVMPFLFRPNNLSGDGLAALKMSDIRINFKYLSELDLGVGANCCFYE